LKKLIIIFFLFIIDSVSAELVITNRIPADIITIQDNENCPTGYVLKSYEVADNASCGSGYYLKSQTIADNASCPTGYFAKYAEVSENADCPAGYFAKSFPIADNESCPSGYYPKYMVQMNNESCPADYTDGVFGSCELDVAIQSVSGVASSDSKGTFKYVCE
jgi:hypothetical protein